MIAKTAQTRLVIGAVLFVALAASVICQQTSTPTTIYRGSVGNSHVQMRLNIQGTNVSGVYSYDSIGEDIKLTGKLNDQGGLELTELNAKGKPNGKFTCKRRIADEVDSECSWSKPDGTREAFVTLSEQHVVSTNGLQLVPKTISNRKTGVGVSYPQISGGSAGAAGFNRRILALTQAAIKEFSPIDEKGVFDTNYNVLLFTDNLISVEMTEYYDGGGAHPNNGFWSLTYDLSGNKELKLEDLFKPDTDYKSALAKFVVSDIDRRAAAFEEENARSEGRKPKPREDPLITEDQLSELSGWAMTPKGLVIYFDFPHVIAVFDRTFIPYSVLSEHLKPNGPAARFQSSGSTKGL
jgi:hypothetical protein